MTTEEMRRRISAVYDGLGWKKKVANMPERQVYAVFMSFEKSGKFKTQAQLEALKKKKEEENGHQMSIFDMWPEKLIKNVDNKEEK